MIVGGTLHVVRVQSVFVWEDGSTKLGMVGPTVHDKLELYNREYSETSGRYRLLGEMRDAG